MRRLFVSLTAAALACCNAIVGFGDLEKTEDAGGIEAGVDEEDARTTTTPKPKSDAEAGPEGPRCDPTKPFQDVVLLLEFDGQAQTHSAVMTPDELEVVYWKGSELRHGRRPERSDSATWTITTEPMDPPADFSVSLSAGGLKLYYWRLDSNGQRALVATRNAKNEAFSASRFLPVPSNRPIFVVATDDNAYYAQLNDGAIDQTIRKGVLTGNGVGLGVEVPNIHAPSSYDNFPVTNESETNLYFNSTRTGSLGGTDVWVARRASKQAEWGVATHVNELSSAQADNVTWVSDDDCEVLLDRASHIFRARRPL